MERHADWWAAAAAAEEPLCADSQSWAVEKQAAAAVPRLSVQQVKLLALQIKRKSAFWFKKNKQTLHRAYGMVSPCAAAVERDVGE